ncbi:hypothetical protein EV426DRAFT_575097 [Tirmania nivea]|nr:hypothetical protein EV426DRAFT_575097 [Tirmania nivea]
MPELRHNTFAQQLMRIFDWTSSNAAPSVVSDEDLSGEVDEPPDYQPQYYKQAVHKPTPHSSLLSQALSSPELGPVDRGRYGKQSQAISFWSLSGASTAELTSDGGLSSRSHSPSPPPPAMLHTYGRMLQNRKVSSKNDTEAVHVVGEDVAIEGLARRRCIRFACGVEPPSRKSSTDDYPIALTEQPQTTQSHPTSIRFAANIQAPQQERGSVIKSSSHTMSYMHAKATPQPSPTPRALIPATRFHEFASSCEETESWMIQVPDKTRLLRVDGVLAKEKDIRKLSEEVEAEVRQEEEDAEELDQIDEDDEGLEDELAHWEEEEDDDQDEDEDDEEDEGDNDEEEEEGEEYLSGNETDNEEGFASDSDDDGSFFSYPRHSGHPLPLLQKPAFSHNVAPFSVGSLNASTFNSDQHLASINLPDSSDFVCGTFDEDKALEDAYACALVEQKRAKYGITPQDIDPSFPSEESDSEEEYCIKSPGTPEHLWTRSRMSFSEEEAPRGKKVHSILTREKTLNEGKIRFNSPAPQRRAHSPAPKRRIVSPPPPISRRNSNEQSPRPTLSRYASRALSPPPPARNVSHPNFNRGHIERTKSLPKGSKPCLKSFGANTQETTTDETPAIRIRGAIDIVKGLEKKRERRRNKLARQRASYTRKGEGVEKMRELGLMLGKGKQAQWMISV